LLPRVEVRSYALDVDDPPWLHGEQANRPAVIAEVIVRNELRGSLLRREKARNDIEAYPQASTLLDNDSLIHS